jgi:ribosomal protein S18 acetylase RimI-like enzyme
VVGVSIAFEPGAWPLTDGAVVYELAWALAAGPLPVRRGIAFDRMVRAAHVGHEHAYLWFLGVHPDEQGRGAGRALLADFDARADACEVPAYLETGTFENVAWYAGAGYEVLGELTLPSGEPVWRMERAHPSR